MRDADVLIIGAGPAGSTTAARLASQGVRVILADRAVFPRGKPCGDYCNPGAVAILTELGLRDALTRRGAAFIEGMTVVAGSGAVLRERFPSGSGALIRRETLDATLLAAAARAGAEIAEAFTAGEIRLGEGIEVRAAHRPLTLRADLLIAADGMRSPIGTRLGLRRPVRDGRFSVGAYFGGAPGLPAGELHLGGDVYGGVARFGDGTANVCLALPPARFRGRAPAAAFAAALRALPVLAETIAGWRPISPFRVTGPIGFAAHRASAARVLLAGDAAGQVEPLTGQGVAAALRSGLEAAEEALRALQAGDLSAAGLAGYDRRRARRLGPARRMLRIVTALALRPRLAPWLVRRLAARPGLARRLLGATGDLLDPGALVTPGYAVRLLLGLDAHAP